MTMFADKRRLLYYGALPLAFGLICIGLYFSGVGPLQSLASPRYNREFGLIENAQNLLLCSALLISWRAARAETSGLWRWLWRMGALACFVLIMEEIDWGEHYYSALTGSMQPDGEHFNLHNRGNTTDTIKRIVDISLPLFFVLLPLGQRLLPAWIKPFLPDRHSVLTLLGGALTSSIAHSLEDGGFANNGSLSGNISEFRELFTYTVGVLYLLELSGRRSGSSEAEDPAPDGTSA